MARGEQIPVTPTVIAWARARAGFSLEDATNIERLKKIELWEQGEAFPTYGQLEIMADQFKVPIAVFFFPEPPDVEPINESFRTLPEAEFNTLPPKVRLLVRKAKAMQLGLSELNLGVNPAKNLITHDLSFRLTVKAQEMARRVRSYLDIDIEEQCSWHDAEMALKKWRECFHDVGIFVFKDAFRASEYSGFCLYDDIFPIIYINNTTAFERQVFTLFHELAHLLFHTSGIDSNNDDYIATLRGNAKRIEVLCNRFAGEFLVPRSAFDEAMSGRDSSEETARDIAQLFKVSWLVIYRKFYDREWIDKTDYEAALAKTISRKSKSDKKESGGNFYNNQMAYLGRPYIGMVLQNYYQQRINEIQAAEYLNIKPSHLGDIEDRFLRGNAGA